MKRSSATYIADIRVRPISDLLDRFLDAEPQEQDRKMVVTGLVECPNGAKFNHILMLNIMQPDKSWRFFLFGMNTSNTFDNRLVNLFSKQKNRKWLSLKFDSKWLRFNLIDDDFEALEEFNHYRNSI